MLPLKMNYREKITYWKSLFPDDTKLTKYWNSVLKQDDPDDLLPAWFFNRFKPDGEGLEAVFNVIPNGEEIHKRILEVFQIAGAGNSRYFLVQNPELITQRELEELAHEFITRVAKMAGICKDYYENEFLEKFAANSPAFRIVEGKPPKMDYEDEFQESVYELKNEFADYIDREPGAERRKVLTTDEYFAMIRDPNYQKPEKKEETKEQAYYYSEALYQMAASKDLVHYVLWPLYENSPIPDAYRPFFDLWRLDIEVQMDVEKNELIFYVKKLQD